MQNHATEIPHAGLIVRLRKMLRRKRESKKSAWKTDQESYSVREADRRFLRELTRVRSSRSKRKDKSHKQGFDSRWTDFTSDELHTNVYSIGGRDLAGVYFFLYLKMATGWVIIWQKLYMASFAKISWQIKSTFFEWDKAKPCHL